MHARGGVWLGCECVAGGVHGRGACMAEVCMVKGACGVVCMAEGACMSGVACVARGVHGRRDSHCSGRAFSSHTFRFEIKSTQAEMEEKCRMRHELLSKSVLCCVFPAQSDIGGTCYLTSLPRWANVGKLASQKIPRSRP